MLRRLHFKTLWQDTFVSQSHLFSLTFLGSTHCAKLKKFWKHGIVYTSSHRDKSYLVLIVCFNVLSEWSMTEWRGNISRAPWALLEKGSTKLLNRFSVSLLPIILHGLRTSHWPAEPLHPGRSDLSLQCFLELHAGTSPACIQSNIHSFIQQAFTWVGEGENFFYPSRFFQLA